MDAPHLHDLTALEQGALVARGEVTPAELVEHYANRADRVGAFVTRTHDRALARARALGPRPDDAGPLWGVPTALKDLQTTRGVRTTFGSRAFAEHVPDVDDEVTRRVEAAGMPWLGKTNTPEVGSPCYTEPDVAPPAVTPWDPGRLRVARFAAPVIADADVHPECLRAWEDASVLLEGLGHRVEDAFISGLELALAAA